MKLNFQEFELIFIASPAGVPWILIISFFNPVFFNTAEGEGGSLRGRGDDVKTCHVVKDMA